MRKLRATRWLVAHMGVCVVLACSSGDTTPAGDGDGQSGDGDSREDGSGGDGSGDGAGPGDGDGATPGDGDGSSPGDGDGDGDGTTGDGLPPPEFAAGELDAPSMGATITMQSIGAPGWYPSRRDPASGQCDAVNSGQCCMTQHELADDKLSPWNEDLIMTLRGPMLVKQFAAYQQQEGAWQRVSVWDERGTKQGIHFDGNGSETGGFPGSVGTECLVDVMPDRPYPCGANSEPYCPADTRESYYGWEGSKLFVLLAAMPHVGDPGYADVTHCSDGPGGNWYDAPWIGLSHGELVRSGKFGDCHCYAKNPAEWWLADGCGQFNVFEVVNDNNQYANLDLFSTNLFAYHGYVGEGPCGQNCNIANLPGNVDLVNKSNSQAASAGAITTPAQGPGAAFRRPARGYRYFLMLLDVNSRQIQLGLVHPQAIPANLGGLLPGLPTRVAQSEIDTLLGLRLPQ